MNVTCTCGTVFQARSAKARYCSDRCRKRKGKADALGDVAPLVAPSPGGGAVELAVRGDLEAADRLETPLGQAALTLARRLDNPGLDTGSAMAAVAKQLEAVLASATKGAAKATAPELLQDELSERRRSRGA